MAKREELTIELGIGATYRNNRFTVYSHGTYPRHSVLAGQPKRTFIESFETLAEAQRVYPQAEVLANGGTTYQEPDLSHLPDDGDY